MEQPTQPRSTSGLFLILLFLALGSGCAALIYEIIWFQLLELTIGSSAVSLAVILATFMGGTGLGSREQLDYLRGAITTAGIESEPR